MECFPGEGNCNPGAMIRLLDEVGFQGRPKAIMSRRHRLIAAMDIARVLTRLVKCRRFFSRSGFSDGFTCAEREGFCPGNLKVPNHAEGSHDFVLVTSHGTEVSVTRSIYDTPTGRESFFGWRLCGGVFLSRYGRVCPDGGNVTARKCHSSSTLVCFITTSVECLASGENSGNEACSVTINIPERLLSWGAALVTFAAAHIR